MSDTLKDFPSLEDRMKEINKVYGGGTIKLASSSKTYRMARIPTGIFILDMYLGGGIPRGKIVDIYGMESTGKTNLMIQIQKTSQGVCRFCNDLFIHTDLSTGEVVLKCSCKKTTPMNSVFLDVEGTYDKLWAARRGVDLSLVSLVEPEYAEQAVDLIDGLLRTNDCDLLFVDSIAAMTPMIEIEKSAEDHQMGAQAGLINKMFRKITAATNSRGRITKFRPTVILANQIRMKLGKVYGCLHGETPIPFTDGTFLPIKEVVERKYKGTVWAWDGQHFVARKIIGWFDNGLVEKASDWITLRFPLLDTANGVGSITVTPEHRLLTEKGWKEAQKVTRKDRLQSFSRSSINGSLRDFLMGVVSGDSHIDKGSKNKAQLRLQDKNEDYLEWKLDKLKDMQFTRGICGPTGIRYSSKASSELAELKEFIGNRDPAVWGNQWTPLGLAVLFMDDGHGDFSKGHCRARISFKRFKRSDRKGAQITRIFELFGIPVTWCKREGSVVLNKDAFLMFARLIAPFVPPCMSYKLPPDFRHLYREFSLSHKEEIAEVFVPVLQIDTGSLRKYRCKHKYDIQVEGAGNYCAGNVLTGVVVHNSPETEPGGFGIKFYPSIKIKTKAGEYKVDAMGRPYARTFPFDITKNKTALANRGDEYVMYLDDHEDYTIGEVDTEAQILRLAAYWGLTELSGSWYRFTVDGEEVKVQGEDKAQAFLRKNPSLADNLKRLVAAKEIVNEIKTDSSDGE